MSGKAESTGRVSLSVVSLYHFDPGTNPDYKSKVEEFVHTRKAFSSNMSI